MGNGVNKSLNAQCALRGLSILSVLESLKSMSDVMPAYYQLIHCSTMSKLCETFPLFEGQGGSVLDCVIISDCSQHRCIDMKVWSVQGTSRQRKHALGILAVRCAKTSARRSNALNVG